MRLTTNTPTSKCRALIPWNPTPTTASAKTAAAPNTTHGHQANRSHTTRHTTTKAAQENGTASAPTQAKAQAKTPETPATNTILSADESAHLLLTLHQLSSLALTALQQGIISRHTHDCLADDTAQAARYINPAH